MLDEWFARQILKTSILLLLGIIFVSLGIWKFVEIIIWVVNHTSVVIK